MPTKLAEVLRRIVATLLVVLVIVIVGMWKYIMPYAISILNQTEQISIHWALIIEGFMSLVAALWIFDPLAIVNKASNPPKKSPWPLFFVMIAAVLVGDFFNPTITIIIHFTIIIIGMTSVMKQKRKHDVKKVAKELFEKKFRATYDEQKIREGIEKAKREGKQITKEEFHAILENAKYVNNPNSINNRVVKLQQVVKNEDFVLRCAKCNGKISPGDRFCPNCRETIDDSIIMVSDK